MRFTILCGAIAVSAAVAGLGLGDPPAPPKDDPVNVAQSGPGSPEEERKGFHLPPGFEVQLVAAEPFVRKPININFDDRGRLWVTESVEYPFAAKADAPHRDTIRILEDTDGDGLADEVTTFADGLNIPIGVLPISKGAIVYSIPAIQRLTDTDGDDRADKREVLYGTYGFKDTHGMTGEFTWGFDGWIYACHGFSNSSEVKGSDGATVKMQSGNTYRFKADGSRIEPWTTGQVNPFGLCFDPLGNLYSCDCHTRPIMMLLRGGDYPHFSKVPDGLGFAPDMMSHDHGSTAIAGITYYAADHFPPAYRDTVFVGNVVTNRINHDRLEAHGSTYRAIEQPDFLKSDDPWFRPVDIKLGPDGALYVADFYNRIIGHYEVPLTHPGRDRERGRIWRIVYRGPDGKGSLPRQPRPDWAKATVPELVQDLGHPNLVVRLKATNQLVERGTPAAPAVREVLRVGSSPWQRMHGLWVLERLGALDDVLLDAATHDPERGVRVHAMRVLAERKELSASLYHLLYAGLNDPDAFVRRGAAEALATHPSLINLRPLLDLYHSVPADDTHLRHMVRLALREQLRSRQAWERLLRVDWTERDLRALADVAPGVPTPESARFLLQYLRQWPEKGDTQLRYVAHIARYEADASALKLLEYLQGDPAAGVQDQLALFKAVQRGIQARGGQLNPVARSWAEDLDRRLLSSRQDNDVVGGIELCGLLKLESARGQLGAIAVDRTCSETQRTAALAALVAIDPARHVALLGHILGDAAEPMALREKAANALAGINQPEAQAELIRCLPAAPERLALLIAQGLVKSHIGAEKLLDAVASGKASARLLQDRGIDLSFSAPNFKDLKGRLDTLTADLPPADKRLQDLLSKRRKAFAAAKTDVVLGSKVFEKNCAICHQLANKGAKIGPQLDGVGIRGVDRLLEDILDPSRNVDQAFRSTTLTLTTGQIVTGLLLREEGEVLVLADSQGKEVRVSKKTIDERVSSPLSPMPSNFGDQLSEGDFSNLLAYLLAQQPGRENTGKSLSVQGGQ